MSQDITFVADIGGTNSRLALAQGAQILPASVARFTNADYPDFWALCQDYLGARGAAPVAAALAVAGPVQDGEVQLTNLDWRLDRPALAQATGAARCFILNDLQAQGHGLDHLPSTAIRAIHGAPDLGAGPALVVGVGTGFNIAPVYGQAPRLVPPAEAGHMSLPLRSAQDLELAQHLGQGGFAAIEDALSGRGFEAIYAWVSGGAALSSHQIFAADTPQAARAIALLARHLGMVLGDLALSYLPFGGIYLVGGLARAMAPYLTEDAFAQPMQDKGRFGAYVGQFAVAVVEDDFAALTGCAGVANS